MASILGGITLVEASYDIISSPEEDHMAGN